MVAQTSFAERLEETRARVARLRSDAFVDYRPLVCGMVLNPVTLGSYNRLVGFENAFAMGGPASMEAILGWVWVQHPEFDQLAVKAKRRVFAEAWRALNPRHPNLNAFVHLVSTLPRWRWMVRLRKATAQQRFDEATDEIRRLMDEALYGFPRGGEDTETPSAWGYRPGPQVAFQAQVLNTFRRIYGMSYAETEALPLKKLAQLWREHIWATSGDKTGLSLMEPEEARIWAEEISHQ